MPQDKYPLLDILTSSVFEIVCCSIKQLRSSRKVAGEKKNKKGKKENKKKEKGEKKEKGQQISSEELDLNN